jgi:hypothetical protein
VRRLERVAVRLEKGSAGMTQPGKPPGAVTKASVAEKA